MPQRRVLAFRARGTDPDLYRLLRPRRGRYGDGTRDGSRGKAAHRCSTHGSRTFDSYPQLACTEACFIQVGNLAAKFETGKVTLDTMRRLQELSDDNFALFIDVRLRPQPRLLSDFSQLLSIHSPSFTILLCTLYLESHSHPLANSSMSVRPANGASPNKARKAFDPNGPSASQESSQAFPASSTTQTGSGIGKKALLGLVGRIPIGVPVRRAKDGTITLSRSIGAAVPIASSARRHQVVKMALVSSVEELAGKRRGETGQHEKEMRPVLQEIDGAVMRAMERAQGDAMDQSEDD